MTSSFAGEAFLIDPPPDYPSEWRSIGTRLVLCVSFFAIGIPILLPVLFGKKVQVEKRPTLEDKSSQQEERESTGNSGKKSKRDKRRKPTKSGARDDDHAATAEMETVVEVPSYILPVLNILCLTVCFFIVASSPNNRVAARAVYQAPLLTAEECRHIIDMAHAAAERNVELASKEAAKEEYLRGAGVISRVDDEADDFDQQHQRQGRNDQVKGRTLLDEPRGWTKDRHTSYPTTDLNLVTDSFAPDDRAYIENILDARLAPLFERVYGIAPGAIRASDMFVVRYDYDKGQRSLRGHTDSSHVSFNVLLNDDFAGGGTRFHNRVAGTYQDANPNPGEVLVNNGLVYHEGLPILSGTRYILVGFMSVDRVDPITQDTTGLNLFASWLSFPWLQFQVKDIIYSSYERTSDGGEPKWTDNKYVRNLFRDVVLAAQLFGDFWAPYTLTKLVGDANASQFIQTLDDAEGKKKEQGVAYRRASWFENQNPHISTAVSKASKCTTSKCTKH